MKTKKLSVNAIQRRKFVNCLVDYIVYCDNLGFSSAEFYAYLRKNNIEAQCKRIENGIPVPNNSNDFVTTAQKAAQDWNIILFKAKVNGVFLYFVDNDTAQLKGLSGRVPSGNTMYSGSKRGLARRKSRMTTIKDFHLDEVEFFNFNNSKTKLKSMAEDALNDFKEFDETNLNVTNKDLSMKDVNEGVALDSSLGDSVVLNENYQCLWKYSLDKRFYFATSFLLREKFIKSTKVEDTIHLTSQNLNDFADLIKIKYGNISRTFQDTNENSSERYFCAMMKSLEYPKTCLNIRLYWRLCNFYHSGQPLQKILCLLVNGQEHGS